LADQRTALAAERAQLRQAQAENTKAALMLKRLETAMVRAGGVQGGPRAPTAHNRSFVSTSTSRYAHPSTAPSLNVSLLPESKDASFAGLGAGGLGQSVGGGVPAGAFVQPPPPPRQTQHHAALRSQVRDLERILQTRPLARHSSHETSLALSRRY
jgi:hypothetical protein